MSYLRRKTGNASLADPHPKREGLAAVSSIWFVGRNHLLAGLNKTVIKFVGGGADIGLNHPQRGIAAG